MTQKPATLNRRKVLTAFVTVACCSGLPSLSQGTPRSMSVDQITDPNSSAATKMFRFEPDLLTLSAGDSVTFLNSRADHTVHSIPDLWPDGVERVAISSKPEAIVQFPKEGYYAFRCRRHGQYGMVMLAIVGQPGNRQEMIERISTVRAGAREQAALLNLFERA